MVEMKLNVIIDETHQQVNSLDRSVIHLLFKKYG